MLNESGDYRGRPVPDCRPDVWQGLERDTDLVDVFEEALYQALPLLEQRGQRINVRLPRERLPITAAREPLTQLLRRVLQMLAAPAVTELWARLGREAAHVVLRLGTDARGYSNRGSAPPDSRLSTALHNLLAELPQSCPQARFRIHVTDTAEVAVAVLFPVAKAAVGGVSPSPLQSLRILVVDDSADTVDTLVTVLDMRGHVTRAAYDGQTALEMAQSFRPDAVLLDLALPGLCGYDIARKLRQQPECGNCRLIAITGLGTDADRAATAAAGFEHHLVKPVDVEHLLAVLEGHAPA